jgi:hypothetical protein
MRFFPLIIVFFDRSDRHLYAEQSAMHDTRWTWTGVDFAAILSVFGVIGVIIIWLIRRKRKLR